MAEINDDILKDIFLSHEDLKIKKEAIRKIKSEKILLELLDVSEYPLTSLIIENMSNKECLANIACNSEYPFDQKIAIGRIDDDEVLAKIALNDDYERIRCLAINKLPQDHDVLSEIALNDPFYMARVMAVKKLDNPEILSRIALNDSCEDVRKEAIIKIREKSKKRRIIL